MSPFGSSRRRDEHERLRRELADERERRLDCERRVATLEAVLEAVPVGLVLADRTGRPIVRTPAATIGGHAEVLLEEALEQILTAAAAGRAGERRLDLFGPPPRTLLLRGIPLGERGALAVIDDLTERTRLDTVRTDFIANVSHELKTPVGALAVLAETVAGDDDPATMRALAERMVAEAHRASDTIDDLLELSRIELGGAAVRDAVDVRAIVADAVERVSVAAERHGIELVVEDGAGTRVLGDRRQLVSAIANLLDNAVKYSGAGSVVTVSCRERDGRAEISVCDHGIGIPAKDLDRIFERFYRVDRARSRETGGTGLGLAIVRHVATNHGGEITVTSREGEGSTFTLRLPIDEGRDGQH